MKGNRAIFLTVLILLGRDLAAPAQVNPSPSQPTTLDISSPLGDLAVAGAGSSPETVAAAIQDRLDYLHLRKLPGRIRLPAGRWRISRPVFLNGDNMELVGASVGRTILEAADGYRAMPMINIGTRTYFPERPLQPCNRVLLTDPTARVLDLSAKGPRYGLRTYAEFPGERFPAVSHLTLDPKNPPTWTKGAAYHANDVVLVNALPLPRPLHCVCVQEHVATPENEPLRGKEWKKLWVAQLPFHGQFFADPFSAGAYDPRTNRASNWGTMDEFTLDFAFTLNAPPAAFKEARTLCGLAPTGWTLYCTPEGRLVFRFPRADGQDQSVELARDCSKAGTYRLAMQLDFPARTIQAWLQKPGAAASTRTLSDRSSIPVGGRFRPAEYSYFTITGDEGGPASANRSSPPLDLTVCGLHMAAARRYADGEALRRRDMNQPADDAFRFFANDAGTMAFLPLTENPPVEGAQTEALLVTVQHGPASGDAGQKGFGYFKSPAGIYGIGRPRVADMTIRPGPMWGVGIVTWNTLGATLRNLDVRGGYYGVGDLFLGAQYTFEVRDCALSGSEAGFCGMSNIVCFQDVTFEPVGRTAVLFSGCNCLMERVRFADPQTFHSEYYVRHLGTVLYGGMNLLTNISAEAPAGCAFPSQAGFSQASIAGTRTSLVLRHGHFANLGPSAALVELGAFPRPAPCLMLVEDCSCRGAPMAALVRAEAPWWSGEVSDFQADSCKRLLDYQPRLVSLWQEKRKYARGEAVSRQGQIYECLMEHQAGMANGPGSHDGPSFWALRVPKIVFTRRTPAPAD